MDEDNKQESEAPFSRRDRFALAALKGLIAAGNTNAADNVLSAKAYADLMIEVLDGHGDGSEAQS